MHRRSVKYLYCYLPMPYGNSMCLKEGIMALISLSPVLYHCSHLFPLLFHFLDTQTLFLCLNYVKLVSDSWWYIYSHFCLGDFIVRSSARWIYFIVLISAHMRSLFLRISIFFTLVTLNITKDFLILLIYYLLIYWFSSLYLGEGQRFCQVCSPGLASTKHSTKSWVNDLCSTIPIDNLWDSIRNP